MKVLICTKNCQSYGKWLECTFTSGYLANSSIVMDKIPIQDRACKLEFDENSSFSAKTICTLWIAAEDNFTFNSKEIDQISKFTKGDFKKDCNII